MTKIKFQDLEGFTSADVEAALSRDDPDELQFVPITVALSCPEPDAAQDVCVRLCSHSHPRVRGHAVMSLGYLARRFRSLDEGIVKVLIESALIDADSYVRMLAKSAADEIHQFLHWQIAGHVYGE